MIVLDTNALIFLVNNSKKLSQKARKRIDLEIDKQAIFVSSISIWEIYLLVKKGKLDLAFDVETWVNKIENFGFIKFVPIDNKIAAKSIILPEPFHKDPADRIIIATAREFGAALVTSDIRMRKYPHVQTVW